MSFRKIEKVLKEEYDHSVSYRTVQRILEDDEIFRREERNRKRRKWCSDSLLKESISFFSMGSIIWSQFSSVFWVWSIWFRTIKNPSPLTFLQEHGLNLSRFRDPLRSVQGLMDVRLWRESVNPVNLWNDNQIIKNSQNHICIWSLQLRMIL